MKRSSKVIIVIASLGLVGAVGAKQFDQWDHNGEHRAGWVAKRVSHHLDLNDTQDAELDSLKATLLDTFGSMRSQKPDSSEIQALFNTEFDQLKAMQMFEQRSMSVSEKAPELIAAFARFYDGLDAAQRHEVSDIIEDKMSHSGRHGFGNHWRRGPFSDNHGDDKDAH